MCEVICLMDNKHAGVTIGFEEETYTAGESDGQAFVVAVVLAGELATDVIVDFVTEPMTAIGKKPTDLTAQINALVYSLHNLSPSLSTSRLPDRATTVDI